MISYPPLNVGRLNDAGHLCQHRIAGEPLVHERGKGTQTPGILVRILRGGSVKPNTAGLILSRSNLFRRYENKLGLGIQKSLDDPASRPAINANIFARDPFHIRPPESNRPLW